MPEVSPTRLTVGSGHDQDGTKKEDPSTYAPSTLIYEPQKRHPKEHPYEYQILRPPPINTSYPFSGHDMNITAAPGVSDVAYGTGKSSVASPSLHQNFMTQGYPTLGTPRFSPSEYPCQFPDCNYVSSRAGDSRRHYIKHLPPTLDCTVKGCKRTGEHGFTRKDNLITHYRRVHGKYPGKSGRTDRDTTIIPVDPKNVDSSVQTEEVDKKAALNDNKIPWPDSSVASEWEAEAAAPLESQRPPKMKGSPPDQETRLGAFIAGANVETSTYWLDCPSKVSVGTFQHTGLQRSGDLGMESSKINEWSLCSDDASVVEQYDDIILDYPGPPLESEDRHATEKIFLGDQTIVASASNYSLEHKLATLESEVLAAFTTKHLPPRYVFVDIEWDVVAFMKDQFRDNEPPTPALGSVVTISGSVHHAQAATCAEYIKQIWAANGLEILEALQAALDDPKHRSQATIAITSVDKSISSNSAPSSRAKSAKLKFDVSDGRVSVVIESEPIDLIVSAISQLAWMGTALRTSTDGRVQYSEPKLKKDEGANWVSFYINFVMSSPDEKDQSCWLPLFSNPVIAQGFRIPERENGEQGLEVPLEIMAALGGARHVSEYEGGLVLKGYSAMFVPISCRQNSVQWHFISARGEDRIPYREASVQCPNRALLGELNHEKLSTTRAFLGWWKDAQTHLATADIDYGSIDWSKAKEASSSPRLTGGTVGISKIFYAQMNFVLGAKDGSYHYSQQEPFQKTIDRAEKFPIVLYDQKDRRAWLVSALAVILHIIQLRNHLKPYVVDGKNVQISPLDPSRQGYAAREAVARNKLLKLFDCETHEEKEYCFRDAILDTWSILDRLMEKEATTQATPGMAVHITGQNTLYGWELMDVAEEERHLKHKAQALKKTAGNWNDLVKDVDAVVLFASGLGDIIRPRSESAELCRKWRSLPKGEDYLAVSVSMLETFYAKAGHRQDHQYITSAKLQWHLGSMLFEKCADIASHCCPCDRLQQVNHESYGLSGHRTTPGGLEANGCVVFGQAHNSFWGPKNKVRRQNAVHTLPNTSIQYGGSITGSRMTDHRLLSRSPTDTVSPEPQEESNHHIRKPKSPPLTLTFTDNRVQDKAIAFKRRRRTSEIQPSESSISDDVASSSEDYAVYPKEHHLALKHDRKSKPPRTATTQTVCTAKEECDVAHVRKCITQLSNTGRSGHHYGCSCTACHVNDFETHSSTELFGTNIDAGHNSTGIAERRGRQRV